MRDGISRIRTIELKSRKTGSRTRQDKPKRHAIELSDGDRIIGKMEIRPSLPADQHKEMAREAAQLMRMGLVHRSMKQWIKKKMKEIAKSGRKSSGQSRPGSLPENPPEQVSEEIPTADSMPAKPDSGNESGKQIGVKQPACPAVDETWQCRETSTQCRIVSVTPCRIFYHLSGKIPCVADRADFIRNWHHRSDRTESVSGNTSNSMNLSSVKAYDLWSNKKQIFSADFHWTRMPGEFRVLVVGVNFETDQVICRDIDSDIAPFTRSCDEFVESFNFVESRHPVVGTFWRRGRSFDSDGNVVVIERFDGKKVTYCNPDVAESETSDDVESFLMQHVPVSNPVSGDLWMNIKHNYMVTVTRVGKSTVRYSIDEEHTTGKAKVNDFRKYFDYVSSC